MTKSKNVALFGEKDTQMPTFMQEDAHLGNEGITSEALATPNIKLLQALSPELREYRDNGADVGQLFNTVSKECVDSIVCANLHLTISHTVWKHRDHGGGKEGDFTTEAEALAYIANLPSPEQYLSQETHKHWLMLLNPSTGEIVSPAVIYMKSTQLAVSRNWNTSLLNKKAPRFASIWELGSKLERNKRNEEFANYQYADRGWADQQLYAQLKENYMGLINSQQAA